MPQIVPLQPKTRNIHPLQEHRLLAADNGWPQIACKEKKGCKNWPRMANSREAILGDAVWRDAYWSGSGFRVEKDICVYDMDVSDAAVAKAILDDLYDQDPDAYEGAIRRNSGKVTLALIWRCRVPFGTLRTHSYTAHPELLPELEAARALPEMTDEEDAVKKEAVRSLMKRLDPQKVEFYGPLSRGRLFQYEGPHSPGRDYECEGGRWPWNTPLADVSLMPAAFDVRDRHGGLLERAEAVLEAHLTRIPEARDVGGAVVYDLTPDMLFYPKNEGRDTIENLTAGLDRGAENGIRGCLPSTRVSQSEANCNLYLSHTGRVVVTDFANNSRLHYMVGDEPTPPVEIPDDVAAVLAAMEPPPERPEQPLDGEIIPPTNRMRDMLRRGPTDRETHDFAVLWLTENLAYFPEAFKGRGGAVSIHADGEFRTPLTLMSLRGALANHGWVEIGPRQGRHPHNPVDSWMAHPQRVTVHGIRMRPELPCPRFMENGLEMINRYLPPEHPTSGGTLLPFMARLKALVPDPDEREWLLNWMRLLVQQPHWRMIAVAMVASDNGAGRGLLAETMQYVLGEHFVVSMPYANISGGSKFNAEVEGRLLLHVNEAAPPEGHKFHNRNAAREALKDFVEPNHSVPFRVEPKGVDAYYTRAAVSTLIFTNNIDGLPLIEADRRFAVLMNGPQMTAEEVTAYRAWMKDAANVGALFRYLRDSKVESNKGVFDPYVSPRFHGRDLMIEAGKTMLDHAWDMAVAKLETASDLYTMSQVIALTRHFAGREVSGDIDAMTRKHTLLNGHRIGRKRPKEINWRIRFDARAKDDDGDGENREIVFAHSTAKAIKWTLSDVKDIKKQLHMAQKAVDEPRKAFNKLLGLVDGGKN